MARIGFFHLPWLGHLNPMTGLAKELQGRGHEVVFFNVGELESEVVARGFPFRSYGEQFVEPGAVRRALAQIGTQRGEEATAAALALVRDLAEALLTQAEPVIRDAELDLWVVDQLEYAAATLARKMDAPFVTAAVSLIKHNEEGIPGYNGRQFGDGPEVRERERQLAGRLAGLVKPYLDYLNSYREQAGMPPFSYQTIWSDLAQISQQPAEFEFPRKELPDCFHFTGPFARDVDRPQVDFPWERLDGRPLVYASFGTLQSQQAELFESVLSVCEGLPAQVVLSLGGVSRQLPSLPENLLVVPFAPQLELLQRAAVSINHAGMNSVLECLALGVPMVVIPIAHDHPGVAVRVEWTQTGLQVPLEHCRSQLGTALGRLLTEPIFRKAAARFAQQISRANGLSRAADIVEQVLRTGRPVLNSAAHSPD